VLSNQRILPAAHEQMRRLANQSGCTVSLASPDGHTMIYLDRCTGETMPYFLGIGSATEMVRTAAGRAYIAGLPDPARHELYARLAPAYKDVWGTLLPALDAACEEVRTRGVCLVDGEWRRDTRAIAAPLVSRNGDHVLSVNCACPAHHLTPSRLLRLWGPRLVHLSQSLSLQF
jgi:DNA-binding IclR family transcriptional regulator